MTTIQVGTRISGGPYNYGIGIVTRYEPGGAGCFVIGRGMQPVSGYVDIAWPTHESTHTPVNIVTALPYRVHTDRLGTPEEIAALRAQAAIHAASEAAKKDEAAKARLELRAHLLAEYPHLLRDGSPLVIAAKNIRAMLRAAHPGVKFSVTSSRFAGGNSIDISWQDGPPSTEVRKITDRFQEGHFDGMTDCYDYSHSVWCDLFGGAKYVHTQRRHSREALLTAISRVSQNYPSDTRLIEEIADKFDTGNLYGDDEWLRRDINEALDHQEPQ